LLQNLNHPEISLQIGNYPIFSYKSDPEDLIEKSAPLFAGSNTFNFFTRKIALPFSCAWVLVAFGIM